MRTETEFYQPDLDAFSKFRYTDSIAHKKAVNKIEWNPLGNKLLSASQNFLRIWSFDEFSGLTKLNDIKSGHDTTIDSITWKDSNIMLTVSKESFKIWDIRQNKAFRSEKSDKKVKPDFVAGQWMPESDIFGISTKENMINMYDRRITGIVETIKYNCDIGKFCWDNSGSILLVAIWDDQVGSIEVRENKKGYQLFDTYPCHPCQVNTFEIDPTNKYLVTGGEDSTINLFDLQDMVCIRSYGATDGGIHSLSFSPNSKYLLVSSDEPQFDIYGVETGRHSWRKQNDNGSSYSQVKWHPKKDIFALVEDEDKMRKNDEGKVRIYCRR